MSAAAAARAEPRRPWRSRPRRRSASTNAGISAGSAEPSASSITTMSPVTAAKPAASALPLPRARLAHHPDRAGSVAWARLDGVVDRAAVDEDHLVDRRQRRQHGGQVARLVERRHHDADPRLPWAPWAHRSHRVLLRPRGHADTPHRYAGATQCRLTPRSASSRLDGAPHTRRLGRQASDHDPIGLPRRRRTVESVWTGHADPPTRRRVGLPRPSGSATGPGPRRRRAARGRGSRSGTGASGRSR